MRRIATTAAILLGLYLAGLSWPQARADGWLLNLPATEAATRPDRSQSEIGVKAGMCSSTAPAARRSR